MWRKPKHRGADAASHLHANAQLLVKSSNRECRGVLIVLAGFAVRLLGLEFPAEKLEEGNL
jgi:hypothetical protein